MATSHPISTRLDEARTMSRREDNPFGSKRRDIESPPVSRWSGRDFRGLSADFRVDILDHDDEVIVVAELPGAEENAIRVNLLNPQTLRITARRAGPSEEESGGGYSILERGNGILSRLIRLPASVTEEGAGTGFKNGVLEVRLRKMRGQSEPGGKEIPIE